MALAAIFVMVATIGMGTMAQAQPSNTELNIPFISNPANVTLNVTLSQISYITQPTQWLDSNSSAQKPYYTNSTAWVVPNSGDLFIVNNTTTATAPTDSAVNFPVANSLGSPINYMFADSRMSFNGTGETAYYAISEGNQTSPPSATGNVLKASAGAAQNVIDVIISEHNATTSTVSVGYFAPSDSGAYQNYTTYSFSSLYVNALQWYDFMIYVQSTGTVVSIMNATGSILASSSSLSPVLDGNVTKIATVSYVSAEAASTAGDMLILDYSYLVDRNTYQTSTPSAPLAGAIGETLGSAAPFDPGASPVGNYTQTASSSNDYLSTNVSLGDFSSVTNSSTVASENSGIINVSLETQKNDTEALSPSALTDVRTASYLPTTVTTNLYVTTWTSEGINASIVQFLQSDIGTALAVDPSEVNVIGYTVTSMGLDISLSNNTMTEVGNYLDNAIPGILNSNGLALEDTQTGAIQAGSMAGYFWSDGAIAAPVIKGNLIENPLTGFVYRSLSQAGFPAGSYIFDGAITVPQWSFLGFASDGQPVFGNVPLMWSPFSALSGAASAVSNFFHSAASTVSNSLSTVKTGVSSAASKIVNVAGSTLGTALHNSATAIQRAAGNVMPMIAGAVGSVGQSITGTISHAVTGLQSGLADVKSSVTGAVLAGVNDVKQGISNIGTSARQLVSGMAAGQAAFFRNAGNTIYTTLGNVGNTIKNVISPIVNTVKNLPTVIVNGTKSLVKGAVSIGQSIASDSSNLGISIKNGAKSVLDNIGNTITSAGKDVRNAFGNMTAAIAGSVKAPFSFVMGLSNNVAHIIEYAAIGIVIVVLVVAGVYFLGGHGKSRGKSHSSHKKHRK